MKLLMISSIMKMKKVFSNWLKMTIKSKMMVKLTITVLKKQELPFIQEMSYSNQVKMKIIN